jgi:hypothetical protein
MVLHYKFNNSIQVVHLQILQVLHGRTSEGLRKMGQQPDSRKSKNIEHRHSKNIDILFRKEFKKHGNCIDILVYTWSYCRN